MVVSFSGCQESAPTESPYDKSFNLYAKDNLVAWCVVPFDNKERSPEERTKMLKKLGFNSLAWDWRQKHLGSLETEISLLEKAGIGLKSVWCWIDGKSESVLGESNEQVFETLERTGTKTEIWVSFPAEYFAGLDEEGKIDKGTETIHYIRKRASAIGCTVSLYNHGDWFGEPKNMVKIIERMNVKDIGLVYNFHHAHHQLGQFVANIDVMMPYLNTVNLNGMRVEGPKILPLGSGDKEKEMMIQLKDAGFKGNIGILGHVEEADVEEILTQNLSGMKKLLREMGDTEALATY